LSAWSFPDEWDADFKLATEVFLPIGTDWRLLKAQCYQESKLHPLAVSPVGAFGLCQFMPGTAREVSRKLGVSADQFWLPAVSIRAAGYYMGKLIYSWKAERPPLDRHKLALASYNAGIGHILKAQKLCDNARLYDDIVPPCLPRVTGRHSAETIGYARNIVDRWYPMMLVH
jgi:soluble lytic murein transglycosylase-like protein